jgi:hypothetical protein
MSNKPKQVTACLQTLRDGNKAQAVRDAIQHGTSMSVISQNPAMVFVGAGCAVALITIVTSVLKRQASHAIGSQKICVQPALKTSLRLEGRQY